MLFIILIFNFAARKNEGIVGKTKEFIIPFKNLSLGFHEFKFNINDLFFEEIEYSRIRKGEINIGLNLEKQESMLILIFKIDGHVGMECDRCLEPMDYPIKGTQQLIVKFGNSFKEENDEIIIIPENEHELNIASFIYEYVHLLLPIQCIHPDDEQGNPTCNNEVFKKLHELNKSNETDPRWDALKKLNLNNN